MIKKIDMATYPRKEHFSHFRTMLNPFFSLTVQIDITEWIKAVKKEGLPVFLSFQYAVAKAANSVPQLRQRIRNDGIIEYDSCGVSYIVACPDETYRYCNVITQLPFAEYLVNSRKAQQEAMADEHLTESEDPEQWFYISCLPWTSYTSLNMPFPDSSFSVPSITWGKYYEENGRIRMPVTIMVNHALVDGVNISKFYENLEMFIKNQVEEMDR